MTSRLVLALSAAVTTVAGQGSLGTPFPNCVDGLLATNQVCNFTLPPPERAAALVAAMTTEEKLQNLVRYFPHPLPLFLSFLLARKILI